MPKKTTEIDISLLRKFVKFDPETGLMTWKHRSADDFDHNVMREFFNENVAGTPAFACPKRAGYLAGKMQGRSVLAHRVIWALHYGEWPKGQVDHLNRIKTDNRIINLRDVTASQNNRNMPISVRNSSGAVGVSFENGRYRARIYVNGKLLNLGSHKSLEAAISARKAGEVKHGYHPNHGT